MVAYTPAVTHPVNHILLHFWGGLFLTQQTRESLFGQRVLRDSRD